ncbi:MAG: hypothetical protein KKC75_06045 [Nanoarchaeota archaeon]|nr:hypothetical protein [Nanoarchaeota archaeon]MBU1004707.1 hypothetical protein [Nanoarchaeota archaeon]MBU1945753.1 hypothetical protein [Nanoarchaeota archaeon]
MWAVKRTDTFLKFLKKHRNNHPLLTELDKMIQRLIEDPFIVGGELAGNLHGHRSTRLAKKFRLVFSIDEKEKAVYLEAIDHRKDVY